MQKPILILVSGASGSGKTTIAKSIISDLPINIKSAIVCQDSYYNKQAEGDVTIRARMNYDHPSSFEWPLIISQLNQLLMRQKIDMPIYDYAVHQRSDKNIIQNSVDVIVFEGLFALYDKNLRELADVKIFVDTPNDECFIRRLVRDVTERQRSMDSIINQWLTTVKPMFFEFIEPTKKHADIIIPWTNHSEIAINSMRNVILGLVK